MAHKYPENKGLDLPKVAEEVLGEWKRNEIFDKSISTRNSDKPYVFFEGPPSANGVPGIHHVMARAIKDIFCRYKTLQGFQVKRKAGWDTHGLPVELGVEKELGITKEDIGKKISVEEYNDACKKAVMRYTDIWNDLTEKMGYWVDMEDPYITYKTKYIESVWYLLKRLFDKGLIYKGYTIQPYSPKAGTGLSSHELNQPGTYQDVKDTTVVAQFKLKEDSEKEFLSAKNIDNQDGRSVYVLAWTTTPWTLPSNTALCVGPKIDYVVVKSKNKYTGEDTLVILAEALVSKHFPVKKDEPFEVVAQLKGHDLVDLKYEQLLPYVLPANNPEEAFRIISGDFVTTEDGTGIVHIAPTFGADDARVADNAGVPAMLVKDDKDQLQPLVDLQGKFVDQMGDLAGRYVKNEYYTENAPDKSVDVEIAIGLKERGLAFNVEKYEHSYPHCWRTDKPILYYPLDSWFIKATEAKGRMVELNNTINWKPESTGTGRFGNWLENLNDWNLSRSRYWGIPIPIWVSEDKQEVKCIGSLEQLKDECDKAVAAGVMDVNPLKDFTVGDMSESNYDAFDAHKPTVDKIILVSDTGQPMKRESDLIDVWFDSGSMPYAQWHYPFENQEYIENNQSFPADFIAEGVDQTRGWFYTLHAIATMCFDSVAYKAVISNGLVLDKNGQKMSKRLGNAVDPFETLSKYGPDATRWYMITNAQPWDNLKFDSDGIQEVQRKFFGTLFNTYNFFALYANVDGFDMNSDQIEHKMRPEIDRWILSKLNSLILTVENALNDYEPTKAGRAIQDFVNNQLSNWYVRLCRRRFWKGELNDDKKSAYQTLYLCLETVSIISSPIAPFFMDRLYQDLVKSGRNGGELSVHLATFPKVDSEHIDVALEERMEMAQKLSSLILSLRRKESLKVRQPLQKIMIPVLNSHFKSQLELIEELVLSEVNVKEMEYLEGDSNKLVKNIKANFKKLGPKYGKQMKEIASLISQFGQDEIAKLEADGKLFAELETGNVEITLEDVEITSSDIPGWLVANDGPLTVALDITLSEELKKEGIAREMVNRIQNLRKDSGFEITDKIKLEIRSVNEISQAVESNLNYICAETLCGDLQLVTDVKDGVQVEVEEGLSTEIRITKLN